MRLILTLFLTLPAHASVWGHTDPCSQVMIQTTRVNQHRRAILFGELPDRHGCPDLTPLSEQYESIEEYDREVVAELDIAETLFLLARWGEVRGPTAMSIRELRRRVREDGANDLWSKALRWRRKHRCIDEAGPCEITVEDWMLPSGHRWASELPMTTVVDSGYRPLPLTTDGGSFPTLAQE